LQSQITNIDTRVTTLESGGGTWWLRHLLDPLGCAWFVADERGGGDGGKAMRSVLPGNATFMGDLGT